MPVKRVNFEVGHRRHGSVGASYPGTLSTGVKAPVVPYKGDSFICQTLYCRVGTAPTGAAAIIQIRKNDSNFGTAVTIAAAASTGSQTQVNLGVDNEDYFDINITQVGSTIAGADLEWVVSER